MDFRSQRSTDVVSTQKSDSASKTGRPFINYELLVWIFFTTFTILAIVDRFTWNVWPREMYNIGQGSAGSDFKDGLKSGPWSVKFYDIMARASGRYTIVALNLLLGTMMHSTMSWLAESWIARNVVDFSNYIDANRRLHKWYGIGIIVMTLVHVWSIVLPCIFDGWRAKVVLGAFEWPLSERGPKGFKDANALTNTMSLQGDDVFRIIEMTILLAVLLPLSVHWLKTRWHLGIHLHNIINVLYFIDIVRRHTHPHSWILNTPVFFAWMVDCAVGLYWRRKRPVVHRKHLSSDYIVLFWNQDKMLGTVGPKYFLRLKESSLLERAHVFTAFENRQNLDLAEGRAWTTGLVIRAYDNERKLRLARQDKQSHTKRIRETEDLALITWGPFLGSMSEYVSCAMRSGRPVTLVGGGSAASYILDALQLHNSQAVGSLTVLYTTNDDALFKWIAGVLQLMRTSGKFMKLHVAMALTYGNDYNENQSDWVSRINESFRYDSDESQSSSSGIDQTGSVTVQYGRLNFEKLVKGGSTAFFQGSGGLQKSVQQACKDKRAKFIAGPVYDQDTRKRNLLKSLRMNCFSRTEDNV